MLYNLFISILKISFDTEYFSGLSGDPGSVQFLPHTWWVATICNSSSKRLNTFFWAVWIPAMQMMHIHTFRQDIHTYKIFKKLKLSPKLVYQ